MQNLQQGKRVILVMVKKHDNELQKELDETPFIYQLYR